MRFAVPNPNQFNISLSPELKKRLAELAVEFKRGKASKVGAEIIETYIDRWADIERQLSKWRDDVDKAMLEGIRRQIRGEDKPPLVKASAQSKTAGRKKTR